MNTDGITVNAVDCHPTFSSTSGKKQSCGIGLRRYTSGDIKTATSAVTEANRQSYQVGRLLRGKVDRGALFNGGVSDRKGDLCGPAAADGAFVRRVLSSGQGQIPCT